MLTSIEGLFLDRMRPFRHRSFFAFFFAQGFSVIGTWSHELARSFIALEIGGTTAALGTLMLSTAIPALICGLHGGVIADAVNPRKVMIITKTLLGVSAISLFALVEFGNITLWMLYGFAFVEGILNSYDAPAFTSTFQRLVPKEDFKMAIMLNSMNFHLSRMLGPAVAGIIMVFHGPSLVFLFDGVTYFLIVIALTRISLREIPHKVQDSAKFFGRLFAGINYINSRPSLRYKQLQLILSISLLIPVSIVVFRSYLKTRFDLDGGDFGFLFSMPALGAGAASITFVLVAMDEPIKNLRFAIPLAVINTLCLPLMPTPLTAGLLLGVGGYFGYMCIASITQSLHFEIEDEFRGRLGSLIMMGFTAISPLMSYPLSLYTDHYGFDRGIRDPTIVFAIGSAILYLLHRFRVDPKLAS